METGVSRSYVPSLRRLKGSMAKGVGGSDSTSERAERDEDEREDDGTSKNGRPGKGLLGSKPRGTSERSESGDSDRGRLTAAIVKWRVDEEMKQEVKVRWVI